MRRTLARKTAACQSPHGLGVQSGHRKPVVSNNVETGSRSPGKASKAASLVTATNEAKRTNLRIIVDRGAVVRGMDSWVKS